MSAAGPAATAAQAFEAAAAPWWQRPRAGFALLAVALAVAPLTVYPVFLMKCLCMALFACAFNLLVGYVGLLSFGHAMFLGGAGYAAAHAAKVWGVTPEVAVLFGIAFSSAMGAVVGALAIRRQGIYFSMITLGLAQMLYFLCLQSKVTRGEDGIQAVPRGALFGVFSLEDNLAMYAFVAVVFFAGFALVYRIIRSPFGAVLTAIRDNETRAISLGYSTDTYKLLAFVLSAGLAGAAGATKALVFQLASLTDVHWSMSGEVVLMTLLGGLGTTFGPVVGAVGIVVLETQLAHLGGWVQVVQGAAFIACVLAFREGIVGRLARWWASRRRAPRG
jgi:branched-chain amino acid transport system permease protein